MNSHHDCLILITIQNNLISAKLHPNKFLFLSGGIPKNLNNNQGQTIVVSGIRTML